MQHGKMVIVEGTDCSGKETQVMKLVQRLEYENRKVFNYYYPNYEDPTGRIVGGPYLGKENISKGYFEEGASNVDPKVATLYYAADFKYSSPKINNYLDSGVNVILDRYCFSSFAHQGGKIKDKSERIENHKWLEDLFFNFLKLRKPDLKILLYMPYKFSERLKKGRDELPDQHESSKKHLLDAENAYLEVADKYDFKIINCVKNNKIRTIDDIHEEVYRYVNEVITK